MHKAVDIAGYVNPFTTSLSALHESLERISQQAENCTACFGKLVKSLSKKAHVKPSTSQRIAAVNICRMIANPYSEEFKGASLGLGFDEFTRIDTIRYRLGVLLLCVLCVNLETLRVGTVANSMFTSIGYKYFAKLSGINVDAIGQYMRDFQANGLVTMIQKNTHILGDAWNYNRSTKFLARKVFYIFGVTKDQLQHDRAYFIAKATEKLAAKNARLAEDRKRQQERRNAREDRRHFFSREGIRNRRVAGQLAKGFQEGEGETVAENPNARFWSEEEYQAYVRGEGAPSAGAEVKATPASAAPEVKSEARRHAEGMAIAETGEFSGAAFDAAVNKYLNQ